MLHVLHDSLEYQICIVLEKHMASKYVDYRSIKSVLLDSDNEDGEVPVETEDDDPLNIIYGLHHIVLEQAITYSDTERRTASLSIEKEVSKHSSQKECRQSETNDTDNEEARILIESRLDEFANGEENSKSCNHCAPKKRLMTMRDLRQGQHICFSGQHFTAHFKPAHKQIALYKHHAIVKEVNKTLSDHEAEITLIEFDKQNGKINVYETKTIYDLKYREIYVCEYRRPRYSPQKIVQRAESIAKGEGMSNNFTSYKFLFSNCEHFATWCVNGTEESLQAQGLRETLNGALTTLFGEGSKVANFVLRFFYLAADEIAVATASSAAKNATGHITLGVTGGAYLIYCIVMTLYLYCHQYRKRKEICRSCLKGKLLDLWLRFGAFALTSIISYLIVHFALPLINPAIGIPLLILFLVLSAAICWVVPKIRKSLASPLQCDKKEIKLISELKPGDVISFRYYMFDHNLVVTKVFPDPKTPTKGIIRCIHYNFPGPFSRRMITEEDFEKDLTETTVKVLDFGIQDTYSGDDVVRRAIARKGEKKWDSTTNRSDHLCYWAKVKDENASKLSYIETSTDDSDKGGSNSSPLGSALIDVKRVHLMKEIQPGDVVQIFGDGCHRNKVMLIGLKEKRTDREFDMDVIRLKGRKAQREKYTMNLDKDSLFVRRYHPAHCYSMEERVKRALNLGGKRSERMTELGLLEEDCILKK